MSKNELLMQKGIPSLEVHTECCYVRATIVKTVLGFTVVEVDMALVHIASIKLDIMSSSEKRKPQLVEFFSVSAIQSICKKSHQLVIVQTLAELILRP